MPAPFPGKVLYRFQPPTDAWTGTSPTGSHEHAGNEITDTYDFRTWRTVVPHAIYETYKYKQVANSGPVKRVKCTFSLNTLPEDDQTYILCIGYYNTLEPDEYLWSYDATLDVLPDGRLKCGTAQSTNTIVASTSYNLELYIYNDPADTNTTWRIYIDGDLWAEGGPSFTDDSGLAYVQFVAGFFPDPPSNAAICDITLHMEDIVWTIEYLPWPGWTMMAPGIA